MDEQITLLNQTILKTLEKCPWTKNQNYSDLIKSIKDELSEVIEALNKDDNDNFEEEIGDLLFTVLLLGHVAEKDNKISLVNQLIGKKIIKRASCIW